MHAIPTSYGGVNFRSRLEARWAAFFDLLGWSWEYEPIDLAGYIPDFILNFKKPLLVEVKPILWSLSAPPRRDVEEVREKIDASGWTGASAILGATLRSTERHHVIGIGLARVDSSAIGWNGTPGAWTSFGAWIGHQDFFHWEFFYGYGGHPTEIPDSFVDLVGAWREAANRVQWKPA